MSDKAELDKLVKARGCARRRLTKLGTEIRSQLGSLVGHEQEDYLCHLILLRRELNEFDDKVEALLVKLDHDDDFLDVEMAECDKYRANVLELLTTVKNIDSVGPRTNSLEQTSKQYGTEVSLRSLPTFCNDKKESFHKFIAEFESILNKHALSSYEKFVYLKEQLGMDPRTLLESFNAERQPYENAKDLLEQAFGDNQIHSEAKFSLYANRPLFQPGIGTPSQSRGTDLPVNDTVLYSADVHCDDEMHDETKSALHVSRPSFLTSIGTPLQGRGTALVGNGTVLDFPDERCKDLLPSKETSLLHAGQPLIPKICIHVDDCSVASSTIHVTEYAEPIKLSSDDTSKLGVDSKYNESIFGDETEVKLLHSVGSFANDRNAEHSCTSDSVLGACVEPCTATDGSKCTAQNSNETAHFLEREPLHCSLGDACVGIKLLSDGICSNGTHTQDSVSYTKHLYSELPFACQDNSEAVEILEHNLIDANVEVSSSLSSIDKQVNELGSSVAVIELK